MKQTHTRTTLVYFSPTHTSRAVGRAVADGIGLPVTEADATFSPIAGTEAGADEVFVVAVPVYGGAVAPIALQRLEKLHGNGTPAVAVVVYGNRDFGHAAVELTAFLTQRGFRVIGGGAFVGEHSYHTEATPIAAGRPSATDLQEAREWGRQVAARLSAGNAAPIDPTRLKCPPSGWLNVFRFARFVLRYRRQQKKRPVKVVPACRADRCKACGACARACPVGAIPAENPLTTDAARCIKCAACVKACPHAARSLATPFAPVLSRNFRRPKPNRWTF